MDALSMLAYALAGRGGAGQKSKAQLEAERLAERRRVDAEYGPPKQVAKTGTKGFKKKKYPLAIRVMGKGFQDLHDSLNQE